MLKKIGIILTLILFLTSQLGLAQEAIYEVYILRNKTELRDTIKSNG